MAKVLRCGDVVPGCPKVLQGEDEHEVLTKAAEHARNDHGMDSIPDEMLTQVRAAVHDE